MTTLRDRVGSLQARLQPGAGSFLAWWGAALAAWLPLRWRGVLGLGRERLWLEHADDGLRFSLEGSTGLRELGRLPAGVEFAAAVDPLAGLLTPALAELPRWLLLPDTAGLRRRLALPAAAAERLHDVLAFEIDRQTPFAAGAVDFDARILGRRAGDGQLDVELVAVPRASLQARLQALGPVATSLAGVDLATAAGAPLGVNLLPRAQRRRRADPQRGWNRVLALVVVLALAAGLWQTLTNRRAAADAFEQGIAARAGAARQAAQQRQRLVDAVAGQAFLEQARSGRPTAVELLDELSRRLPDSTYLEKVAIEGGRLILIGASSEASALVGRLEGSPLWHAPALTGALQPDPRTRRDRFTLIAELGARPTGKDAVDAAARAPDQETGDDAAR
jgi:general secretion pathway protein L